MTIKPCQACDHPERAAIEKALDRGEPYRELNREFKVSIGSLKRHRKAHLGGEGEPALTAAAEEVVEEVDLPEQDLSDFPETLDALAEVRPLGGSTGATLLEDGDGRLFVAKRGASTGQLLEEFAANRIYHALGVPVPRQKLYESPEAPVRLAEYIEGEQLSYLFGDERERLIEKAREHFAVDALLANWDVVGNLEDNLILTPEGEVYRVDNGGALRYWARGERKTPERFSRAVGELDSMRDEDAATGEVFSELSYGEVAAQIRGLCAKRGLVLAAAAEGLRGVLAERLSYMEERAGWERTYLRFGRAPEGGISYNTETGEPEEGLSAYGAYRSPVGAYLIDAPLKGNSDEAAMYWVTIANMVVSGRPLYEVSGTEIVGEGSSGESLLEDARLTPISPFSRVLFPEWLGPEAGRLADMYNRWRKSRGASLGRRAQGATDTRFIDRPLANQAVRAVIGALEASHPETSLSSYEERERVVRRAFQAPIRQVMGWS